MHLVVDHLPRVSTCLDWTTGTKNYFRYIPSVICSPSCWLFTDDDCHYLCNKSALVTSFTRLPDSAPAPAPEPVLSSAEQTSSVEAPVSSVTPAPSSEPSTGLEDSWQEEYNRQVSQWRADAAIAREKAEKTRAEWEERRKTEEEQEKREAARKKSEREATLSGWETVSPAEETVSQKIAREEANSGDRVRVDAVVPSLTEATRSVGTSGSPQHTRMFGPELVIPAPIRPDAKDLVSVGVPSSGPKVQSLSYILGVGCYVHFSSFSRLRPKTLQMNPQEPPRRRMLVCLVPVHGRKSIHSHLHFRLFLKISHHLPKKKVPGLKVLQAH